ncbi:MAG: shikimate dehydrogenase [Spirochaetales bacterium]|uniref:Shikimate dehydrogenase n=1 Tax=Candidatus Thalassospirochaeta sargassi TaxID=3119039 RepID=A0AAJ1IFD4_9SPIO|nr:shikimate dehydrogenase [Spirochaetales bacterium]
MANNYTKAERPTMYFIGVTTGKSSIMKVFPEWAKYLEIDAEIKGFDFKPHDEPAKYLEAVRFIKNDPKSEGALVTTHKLDLLEACKGEFEGLGPYAKELREISSISKRGNELWGHAKDPVTVGLSFEAIVKDGYWNETGAEMLILGAGGSSLALVTYLIGRAKDGRDLPSKIIINNRSEKRLNELKKHAVKMVEEAGVDINLGFNLCPSPADNDAVAVNLKEGSLVVNATGLGKDSPGSPLTDDVIFPQKGIVWEFNYRGDLVFLDQANAQKEARQLSVVDGWFYFIHGWTRVIAEVFHKDIPTEGPVFNELCEIAARAGSPTNKAG